MVGRVAVTVYVVVCVVVCAVLAGILWAGRVGAAPGTWVWPLPGTPRVTRSFEPPQTAYGRGHRGVDLAGRIGQDVRAAGAGRVSFAGPVAGVGVVAIAHPAGLRTTYQPVRASVRAGVVVGAGQLIGRLDAGHPGCPVGACLHWGLLRGSVYLDPLSLLGRGRVRLLPDSGPGTGAAGGAGAVAAPTAGGPGRPDAARRERLLASGAGDAAVPAMAPTTAGAIAVVLGMLVLLARRRPP